MTDRHVRAQAYITTRTERRSGMGLRRLGNCVKRYMDRRGEQLERGTRVVGAMSDATPGPLQGACQAAELSGGTLRLKVKPGPEMWLANVEKNEMAARLGVKNIKLCV